MAPLYTYAAVSLSNVVATTCQYEALKYVSFPVQVGHLRTHTHTHVHTQTYGARGDGAQAQPERGGRGVICGRLHPLSQGQEGRGHGQRWHCRWYDAACLLAIFLGFSLPAASCSSL